MKNIYLFCLLASTVLLTQCESPKPFHAWFWTSKQYYKPYLLYINDSLRGPLPYLPTAPACENDSSKEKALYALMPSGRYTISIKDSAGNIVFKDKWELKLSENHKSISIQQNKKYEYSGAKLSSEGTQDCLLIELFY